MMTPTCLNCKATDHEKTLIKLLYKGIEIHICPQCLPILIHHPEKLEDTLKLYGPIEHNHGHSEG